MRSLVLLALLGTACQEPFGTDRHDLVGLRVAAVSARPLPGDEVQLELAAVVAGRPWSDAPLQIAWFDAAELTVDEIAALSPEGGLASGPAPTLDRGDALSLAIVASDGSDTWRGTVDLPPAADRADPPPLGDVLVQPTGQRIDALTGDDLDLEVRRAWTLGDAVDAIAVGDVARFSTPAHEGVLVRWMSTQPGGRFLETTDASTDWTAASFVRDDEEIEDLELEPEGVRTLLALGMDPSGGAANAWRARELFVGDVPTGIFTASGRFLPTDVAVEAAYVRGELVADDDAPSGVRLQGAQAATADDDPGTAALPCTLPVTGFFDPDWLLAQHCTRQDVLGATVVVEARP